MPSAFSVHCAGRITTPSGTTPSRTSRQQGDQRTGWTVGGGIEWAFWNNWSAKVEYDFYDFGTRSVTLAGTFAGAP